MTFFKILQKIRISYDDAKEEEEYLQIKVPLLKQFLTTLLICVMVLLIILIFRFFIILHAPIQGYISIGILLLNILLLAVRNLFGKWTEHVLIGYLLCIVSVIIFNIENFLLSIGSCEAFYIGYAFALLHRILGYRVVKVHFMILFHIISLILRLTRLNQHDFMTSLIVTVVEIFTVSIGVKSEKKERELFDSLYKSRKQLFKFKDFLTDHLRDEMTILSQDHSKVYFMNKAFRNSFECDDISQVKDVFQRLLIEKDSIAKQLPLFTDIVSSFSENGEGLSLFKLLELLPVNNDLIKANGNLVFELYESSNVFEVSSPFLSAKNGDSQEYIFKSEKIAENSSKGTRILEDMANTKSEQSTNMKAFKKDKKQFSSIGHHMYKNFYSLQENQNQGDSFLNSPISRKINEKEEVTRFFKVKVLFLPWDDEEAFALIFDDITQQKTITELKIADKNKDLVIASVSHELRTPLHGMLGMIDIVKKKVADPDVLFYLNSCRNNGVFLLNLVNSLLDISQMKCNKPINLINAKFSISELLEELKELFESFSIAKSLYLKIEIDDSVPKSIVTDRNRLNQILINLIANAFKFTFEGGITIRVKSHLGSTKRIKFIVQDTGLGIKKEDQKRLFKLFGKLKQQDKNTNTNGVGLGLTIANDLAMLLNNSDQQSIHLDSEIGKGSTFWFYIESKMTNESSSKGSSSLTCADELHPGTSCLNPYLSLNAFNFKKVNRVANKYKSVKPVFQASINTKKSFLSFAFNDFNSKNENKIPGSNKDMPLKNNHNKEYTNIIQENESWCLIVDDNPFNLMIARHLMKEKGYQIKTALNGEEAIQVAEEHQAQGFKVILMDCQMPIMDGYEATKLLRKKMEKGEIPNCPIIALTANNRDDQHEKQCEEAGMSGVLTKPFQPNELEVILKTLENKNNTFFI